MYVPFRCASKKTSDSAAIAHMQRNGRRNFSRRSGRMHNTASMPRRYTVGISSLERITSDGDRSPNGCRYRHRISFFTASTGLKKPLILPDTLDPKKIFLKVAGSFAM